MIKIMILNISKIAMKNIGFFSIYSSTARMYLLTISKHLKFIKQ